MDTFQPASTKNIFPIWYYNSQLFEIAGITESHTKV